MEHSTSPAPALRIQGPLPTCPQALTNEQVFRFPSTFTFIFRAFTSIEGIGKGLDPNYDISKLAQPFIEQLVFTTEGGAKSTLKTVGKATGLNTVDVNMAITSPRRIAYVEVCPNPDSRTHVFTLIPTPLVPYYRPTLTHIPPHHMHTAALTYVPTHTYPHMPTQSRSSPTPTPTLTLIHFGNHHPLPLICLVAF